MSASVKDDGCGSSGPGMIGSDVFWQLGKCYRPPKVSKTLASRGSPPALLMEFYKQLELFLESAVACGQTQPQPPPHSPGNGSNTTCLSRRKVAEKEPSCSS